MPVILFYCPIFAIYQVHLIALLCNKIAAVATDFSIEQLKKRFAHHPHITREEISGDSILLHLKESPTGAKRKSIDEIQIHGNAFFAAQDSLRFTGCL